MSHSDALDELATREKKPEHAWKRIMQLQLADVSEYLSEYMPSCLGASLLRASSPDVKTAEEKVKGLINVNEIVLFIKLGCGSCRQAEEKLRAEQLTRAFSLAVVPASTADLPIHLVLRNLLRLPTGTPSYPVLIINGRYFGGGDELRALLQKEGVLFAAALEAGATQFEAPPIDRDSAVDRPFHLCAAAGGQKAISFQLSIFANVVRPSCASRVLCLSRRLCPATISKLSIPATLLP